MVMCTDEQLDSPSQAWYCMYQLSCCHVWDIASGTFRGKMALMWYYMTVLFVMLCLAYPAWIQAYDNPITPLPPQWEGRRYIATLATNAALQARGLTPDTARSLRCKAQAL